MAVAVAVVDVNNKFQDLSDVASTDADTLFVRSGNPANSFIVTTDSDTKLELALDARLNNSGDEFPPNVDSNIFSVEEALLTNVRFAYSVASLDGAIDLTKYDIALRIDTDPSAGENFFTFKLQDRTPNDPSDHNFQWNLVGGVADGPIIDDGGTSSVTQNIEAIQFFGTKAQPQKGGQYTIELEASQAGVAIASSEIRIDIKGSSIYSITASPVSIAEGTTGNGANISYTVSRTGDISQASSVAVALTGTATVVTDYGVAGVTNNRLAFAAGQNTATFTVTTKPDAIVEGNETVIATISDPENASSSDFGSIGTASATATITNDDLAPTTPTTGPDTITGTAAADTTNAGLGNDTVAAGGGNDTVNGNEGNDAVNGDDGNDAINGNQGDDAVNGNVGNDTVQGGQGNDIVKGGQGNDSVSGDFGDDMTYGDLGNDTVSGGDGNDTVYGGQGPIANAVDGADSVSGGLGNDSVNGNAGNDTVNGNQGSDTVSGGQGNDFVQGGQGDDTVYGDLGNDTLSGDLGNDILTGGAGADVFVFAAGSGNDVITDFDFAAGDRLDFGDRNYTSEAGPNGSTEINFMDGSTIILQGVTSDEFNANFVA